MVRRHIIFYGQVQGVGFRYYAVHEARVLGLTGWVENLWDGTVEMEVQGREEDIDRLLLFLEGQQWIDIRGMDAETIPLQEEREFCRKGY